MTLFSVLSLLLKKFINGKKFNAFPKRHPSATKILAIKKNEFLNFSFIIKYTK